MTAHKKRKIGITDTTLRDGHQSLWATRLPTEDMLPIAKKIDQIGYHSVEVWGGASFDSCLRFLNEDPWERLATLRKAMPNTKFQALFRGQNLVGYKHYPDDVVEAFVKKAVDMGIDIIRVFDALNDTRNTESTFKAARKKKGGVHIQAAVSYTISPIHNNDYFVGIAKRYADMGADSICLKDMAGLLAPNDAYSLISDIKKAVNLPIQLHSHYVSGMAAMSYLKAIEAGADVIDTAISPLAMTSSQPATETMVYALKDVYDVGIDINALLEIAEYFQQLSPKFMNMATQNRIDTEVLSHQVPGGMISNLYSQLEQQKAAHRLHDVLVELPKVREDLGYPPLVTPTSQILGTQAVLNVLLGHRYKVVPAEVKAYVRGLYGKPPSEVNPAVKALILGDEEPITCRPADMLEPGLKKAKAEIAGMSDKDTDILSYAVFPQVWLQYHNSLNEPAPAVADSEDTKNMFSNVRMMLSGLGSN